MTQMADSSGLFNKDAEKVVLARLLVNPAIRPELRIDASDFSPDVNRVVMSAIDSCIASGIAINAFAVIDRLNSLGVKLGGVLEPSVYINSLSLLNVDDSTAIERAKEVKRWTVRRELHKIGEDILTITANDKPTKDGKVKKASELVAEVTERFNRHVNVLSGGGADDEPQDLYASIRGLLEAENVYDTNSVMSPWDIYNDFYGGFDAGQVFAICARAKAGKSTWVMSMLDQIMRKNDDFCALIMDTELTLEEVGFRLVSSLTGIKEYYIRHKVYKRRGREEMRKKIEDAYKLIEPFMNRVDHRYCGGMSWDQTESIIRRWVFKKKVIEKKRVMVVYDYLKYDGSDFDSSNNRDLVIGKKANGVKNLAKELQIPIWALVQASRQNEDTKEGRRISNGSVVADSDMISRLFTNIYLLQRMSDEDRANLFQNAPTDATHALLPIYTRQLGPEEMGLSGRVKYQETPPGAKKPVDRWCDNYICFSFHMFKVTEIATFRELYERACMMGAGAQIQPEGKPRGEML